MGSLAQHTPGGEVHPRTGDSWPGRWQTKKSLRNDAALSSNPSCLCHGVFVHLIMEERDFIIQALHGFPR